MAITKTATLTFRIDPDLKAALREAAQLEHRSVANMVEFLIRDHCARNGIAIAGGDRSASHPRARRSPSGPTGRTASSFTGPIPPSSKTRCSICRSAGRSQRTSWKRARRCSSSSRTYFKKIIQDLEELVLADSSKDEFNEIFKLIFAKIWDEKEAQETRKDKTVEFRKAVDPEITFDRIKGLFHRACEEWPGIFRQGEDIELAKRHLQVCVGPIEGVRLLGSNLRIMDDAFEYLLPTEAKKK